MPHFLIYLHQKVDNKIKKVEVEFKKAEWINSHYEQGLPYINLNKWAKKQVDKCLSVSLKNFSTYKALDWGDVIKKDNRYVIWHKYSFENDEKKKFIMEHFFNLNVHGIVMNIFAENQF